MSKAAFSTSLQLSELLFFREKKRVISSGILSVTWRKHTKAAQRLATVSKSDKSGGKIELSLLVLGVYSILCNLF